MIHYNAIRDYLDAHPEWKDDAVPLCDSVGADPDDRYTFEVPEVTCPDCIDRLTDQIVDEICGRTR